MCVVGVVFVVNKPSHLLRLLEHGLVEGQLQRSVREPLEELVDQQCLLVSRGRRCLGLLLDEVNHKSQ